MTWIIAIILFVGGLGSGMVFPILPALGAKLGISGFMIGLILSTDKVTRLICNLPAGRLFPRLGVRRTLSGAMLAATGGLLCFSAAMHSPSPTVWLFVGRVIYGLGTAFLIVGAQAGVMALSKESDRGRKMASIRLAVNAAIPGGLVLGGLVADLYSDYAAFLVGSAITFVGALLAIFLLRETGDARGRRKQSAHRHAGGRFFPRNPGLISAYCINFMIYLTVQGTLLSTLVLFLQKQQLYLGGLEAQGSSGLIMAIMISCAACSSFAAGRILDRLPRRSQLLFPALGGLTAGFVILSQASSVAGVIAASILIGLTYNSLTIPTMAFIGDRVHSSEQSHTIGVYQFFGDLGGTLGPVLGIQAVAFMGADTLYLVSGVFCLCCFPAVFRLARIERKSSPDLDEPEVDVPGAECPLS